LARPFPTLVGPGVAQPPRFSFEAAAAAASSDERDRALALGSGVAQPADADAEEAASLSAGGVPGAPSELRAVRTALLGGSEGSGEPHAVSVICRKGEDLQ